MEHNGEHFLDFTDAAEKTGYSRHTIVKSVQLGVFSTVQPRDGWRKFIPEWELEAVGRRPLGSYKTLLYMNGLRRERSESALRAAVDKEFNMNSNFNEGITATATEKAIADALHREVAPLLTELHGFRTMFDEFRTSMTYFAQQAGPFMQVMLDIANAANNANRIESTPLESKSRR